MDELYGDGPEGGEYWCHSCASVVDPPAGGFCVHCNSEFVEAVDPEYPPDGYVPAAAHMIPEDIAGNVELDGVAAMAQQADPMAVLLNVMGGGRMGPPGGPIDLAQLIGNMLRGMGGDPLPQAAPVFGANPGPGFIPFGGLLDMLGGIGPGGAGGGGGPGLAFGDYAGANIEAIMHRLMASDGNRYGNPPASRAFVSGLPEVRATAADVAADRDCAICQDKFQADEPLVQLPCEHLFHRQCLTPWLEHQSTCPVCRTLLPTDDPDYEARRRQQQQQRG